MGKTKSFADKIGMPLNFSSYRSQMPDLRYIGLADSKPIDANKKIYFLKESGVSEALLLMSIV